MGTNRDRQGQKRDTRDKKDRHSQTGTDIDRERQKQT